MGEEGEGGEDKGEGEGKEFGALVRKKSSFVSVRLFSVFFLSGWEQSDVCSPPPYAIVPPCKFSASFSLILSIIL